MGVLADDDDEGVTVGLGVDATGGVAAVVGAAGELLGAVACVVGSALGVQAVAEVPTASTSSPETAYFFTIVRICALSTGIGWCSNGPLCRQGRPGQPFPVPSMRIREDVCRG